MSEAAQRLPLAQAQALAQDVVKLLAPYCETIDVAGSIRRERADIGDLEMVCVPRMLEQVQEDLFGAAVAVTVVNRLDAFCQLLVDDGIFHHRRDKNGRPAFGSKYKRLLFDGFGLDLFSVLPPAQFGVVYMIRTGSAEFSHRFVTAQALGGWMPFAYFVRDGALWRGGEMLETPDERSLFDAVGQPYLDPPLREVR